MSEGIRIRHHIRRNELLPVPLLHKPFPPGDKRPDCGICQRFFNRVTQHPCKTLHLQLDATGTVIVSSEIWADVQRTWNRGGFTVANQVLAPPTQVMRPPTVQQRIDGIDLGGGLAATQRSQIFHAGGTTRPDYNPTKRTVTLDEYMDVTGAIGVSPDVALNTLLASLLGMLKPRGETTNGNHRL
jgi:hypothetical protein